ncbi:cytochrome c oxidase biogenesis protein Cmc1 like-domain-containing protein [Xylaria sp. FL1042]|nr:cytochrome c oxidase biogenesis protein Cmc1 like-domain-containing protein [Xylaria sp. FL1042]
MAVAAAGTAVGAVQATPITMAPMEETDGSRRRGEEASKEGGSAEGRLPMPSRNPLPLSASQEAQVREVFNARVRAHCADEIKAFAECARGRTFSIPFSCRTLSHAMNSCMLAHATPAEHDRAREDWFAARMTRARERERKERRKIEQERFHREWWGLPERDPEEVRRELEKLERPERIGDIPDNYSLSEIMWSGFDDFDKDQAFTGSIEASPALTPPSSSKHYFAIETDTRTLEAGEPSKTMTVQCCANHADPYRIREGVNYLQRLGNRVMCANSPQSCGRVSCSYKSGIYWCNDKTVPSDAYKCKMFGHYASVILDQCAIYGTNPRVCGSLHDEEFDLTAIVKGAPC